MFALFEKNKYVKRSVFFTVFKRERFFQSRFIPIPKRTMHSRENCIYQAFSFFIFPCICLLEDYVSFP